MIVVGESGRRYALGKKIGAGGQGTVWRVASDRYCVVKTLMEPDTEVSAPEEDDAIHGYEQSRIVRDEVRYEKFTRKVNSLIALGVLTDIQRVALPEEVLKRPYCGYTMRLMDGLESISKQMKHTDESAISHYGKNSSLKKKLLVLRCLADIVRKLHRQGLVYCDLSANNVFVSQNPNDHEVWLIDSDNLVYSNMSRKCIGTPNYQAPEIYMQESACSYNSDMYSFALIAFEYLTGARPFSNDNISHDKGWDEVDVTDDWLDVGLDPIESGDVDYGYEFGDDYLGVPLNFVANEKMRKLFYRTFCESGRKNPQTRPSANEWYEALDEACGSICICPKEHAFIGPDCAWCSAKKQDNPEMKIYVLKTSTPIGEEDLDWENTPPPKIQEYKYKEQYLYQSERWQNVEIGANIITLQDGEGTIRVTLVDDGIVFSDSDCRSNKVKLYQIKDSKRTACYKYPTLNVGDKYNMIAELNSKKTGEKKSYTQIILERLR